MQLIRTTELTKFYQCPYRYKYEEPSSNLKHTWLGEILHYIADVPKDVMLQILADYFNNYPDVDLEYKVEKLLQKMLAYYELLTKDADTILKEIRLYKNFFNEYYLTGKFDLAIKRKNKWHLYDWKTTSDISVFKSGEIWNINLQHIIYPVLLKNTLQLDQDEIEFNYIAINKKNAQITTHSKIININEAEEMLDGIMNEYVYCLTSDEWEQRPNKYCFTCKLKSQCNSYKSK